MNLKRVYKYRGTKRNKDNLQYVFDRVEKDNKVAYYLNMENPLIKQLQENLSDSDIIIFKALLKQIEEHLPLDSIQYDLASNKGFEENEDTDDEIYEEIMLLLSNQTTEKVKSCC